MTTKQNETKNDIQKPSKKEQMAALRAAYFVPKLTKIDGIVGMDLYAKRLTAGEVNKFGRLSGEFEKNFPNDGLNGERKFSLELFDADGNQAFDYNDMDDMQFLSDMPIAMRQIINNAMVAANTGLDSLKNG